jgi:uncharacterized tellurite resistance protein B-like protein
MNDSVEKKPLLDTIRSFIKERINPDPERDAREAAERARMAAAALLVEVVKSDEDFSATERQAVIGAVRRSFGLDQGAAEQLVQLAEAEADAAHDLYQFTSLINAAYSPQQKLQLIEELWRVAWSDNDLHRYEEHVIRKVADLIHVSHSGFIATKLLVQGTR